jgi:serine protease Do
MKRNAVAWAALVVSVAALIGSRNFSRAVPAAQEVPEEGQKVARALSDAFGAVADFVKPSVVQINVEKKAGPLRFGRGRTPGKPGDPKIPAPKDYEDLLKKFFGPDFKFENQQLAEGTGSGFVYDDKGHILTNNHVVAGAKKITVSFHDGVEAPATVVGTFPEADVAVIKVDATNYRPIPQGKSSKLKVGEWVLAIGSPFGLDQTVTAGIISATQRNDVDINQFESFIQTDAAINPGNSGGPLVDMTGRVVGINSAIATESRANSGVGFAIPIEMASRLADKLIKNGKINHALMGVGIEAVKPTLARQLGLDPKTKGLLVNSVGNDTPAAKAGLKEGDIITTFDGQPVYTRKDLQYLVTTSDVGHAYDLTYVRNGREHKTQVTPADSDAVLAAMPRPIVEVSPGATEKASQVNDFGIAVQAVTPELAAKYKYEKGAEGLVITEVKEESPAHSAGLEPGDRITKIIKDQKPQKVQSVKEFDEYVKSNPEVAVFVEDVNKVLPGEYKVLSKPKK